MEPDGNLTVEVTEGLAKQWELPETNTIVFQFAHYRTWRPDSHGLTVVYGKGHPDKKSGYLCIPWHNILAYDITTNSDEYVEWAQVQKGKEVKSDGTGSA